MKVVLIFRSPTSVNVPGHLCVMSPGLLLFSCRTLELPWLENKTKISCIPEGAYKCSWTYSPKFKTILPELENVPGRTAIRIHSGNYASLKKSHSQGCILVGTDFDDINKDGIIDIINSRSTFLALKSVLLNEPFLIFIVS